MYIEVESECCTPKTIVTLYASYTEILKSFKFFVRFFYFSG